MELFKGKNNLILIVLLLLLLLVPGFIFSQDATNDLDNLMLDDLLTDIDSTDSTDENKISEIGFMFSLLGEHGFNYKLPVIYDHSDYYGHMKAPRFNNDLGIEIEYKILSVVSHWQIDAVVTDSGNIEDVLYVKPLENSITLKPWKFNIGLGYQYFTWGTGDKINPTDNINSTDYRTTSEDNKNSVLSAYVEFFPVSFFSIETIYVPFLSRDQVPVDYVEALKEELEISDVSIVSPDYDPSTFTLGTKLNFYFQYADFSFSYLYDVDPYYTPVIKLKNVYDMFYSIKSVELVNNRIHQFGADIKTNIDRFGIWAELAYKMSDDYLMSSYKLRNHQLSWVAGFDFNYGPNQDFYMNFQFFGDFNPFYDTTLSSEYVESDFMGTELPFKTGKDKDHYEEYYYRVLVNELGGVTETVNLGLSFSMQFPFTIGHLSFEPSLAAGYTLPLLYDNSEVMRYGSLIIKPEFVFTPIDALDFIIGADLYMAFEKEEGENVTIATEDGMGMYYYESAIYLEVNYKWGFDFKK